MPADAPFGVSAISTDERAHPPLMHRVRRHLTGETLDDAVTTVNPCFAGKAELKKAVDEYLAQDCPKNPNCTAGGLYGWPMNSWCVSKVTDMSYLFFKMRTLDENITSWDVSSVTNMERMFYKAIKFNGDVSQWNVSSVTNMARMFSETAFNGDLSRWNVAGVTDMSFMFYGAFVFEGGNLSRWNVSAVTTMQAMFSVAKAFNGDISAWNVSGVTDMTGMFFVTESFNVDISRWDVPNVARMTNMFLRSEAFNDDISGWNISKLTRAGAMFNLATSFNQNLCSWADKFPYGRDSTDIFQASNCTSTSDPVRDRGGPFCASDCPTSSPTTASPTRVRQQGGNDEDYNAVRSLVPSPRFQVLVLGGLCCTYIILSRIWINRQLENSHDRMHLSRRV
ncbi:hypothetical protein ACHAW5_000735 [Stephanodiscus triporus]|uniref:Surface protein n=1 Tax=Stephanodiscus triporus TaxID=2934178 RepID=A0ABD3P0N5_9STRA